MTLKPGTRLGPYDIVAAIGAGGMGEVYRARDTKLNRDVAIKVLLAAVATDPDRLARFEREAQVLASLNHPNIAHIHGLEEAGGTPALVMELVEGPTLADLLASASRLQAPGLKSEAPKSAARSLPIDDALAIARQIAEALEAAHEQGIIHRDLKPANVKVRPDGTVKVLDFGLARALDPTSSSGANATMSPTISMHATQAGIILGTAAYMSPEQARGRVVDRRADIWAFGVVLFEMVTGTRAFDAEDISATLAFVITKEPDWNALPADTPLSIRKLLRRCLEKDPKRRLQAIGDARLDIDEALAAPSIEGPTPALVRRAPAWRRAMPWLATAIVPAAIVAAIGWAWWHSGPAAKPQPMRFAIVPPPSQPFLSTGTDRGLVISPDGTHLVYVAAANGGLPQLMVRSIDQLDAIPLRGTNGFRSPFLSPDGRWIGFSAASDLRKVSITGGPAISICSFTGAPRGATWSSDGTIIFATNDPRTGLLSVPDASGEPRVLTTPDAAHGELDHVLPSLLPGGRAVLFTIVSNGPIENAQIAALDLKSGQHHTLIRGGSQAQYVEPSVAGTPGYLVYAVGGTLRAVRFDPLKLEVLSDPVPVLDQLTTYSDGAAEFTVSQQGALVYVPGGAMSGISRSLTWVDRQGHEDPTKAPPHGYFYPRISPDGKEIALDVRDQNNDIWIWDLAGETLTRLTDDPSTDWYPVWTADSRRIIFSSARAGISNLFWQSADNTGTVERLTTSQSAQFPTSMSPDGPVFTEVTPKAGRDIQFLKMDLSNVLKAGNSTATNARQVTPLLHGASNEDNGEVSWDGHWLAYQADDGGQSQIYVRPFPDVDGGHWTISTNGGSKPLWARSGTELFYLDATNALTVVPVQTAPTFRRLGNPSKLLDGRYYSNGNGRNYDVSPDGKRFLMIKEAGTADRNTTPASMVVVLNWLEELKAKVPIK